MPWISGRAGMPYGSHHLYTIAGCVWDGAHRNWVPRCVWIHQTDIHAEANSEIPMAVCFVDSTTTVNLASACLWTCCDTCIAKIAVHQSGQSSAIVDADLAR
nr:unnamed protein product [Spirometra erinaceieuropaei]